MGPAWPDTYSVTKTIRKGRIKVLLTSSLIIVILGVLYIFSRSGADFNPGRMVSAVLACAGMIGICLIPSLQACDQLLAAYPTQVPGEDTPHRIGLRDVDVDNLPGWCAGAFDRTTGMRYLAASGSCAGPEAFCSSFSVVQNTQRTLQRHQHCS